jgi:hypothetical protein
MENMAFDTNDYSSEIAVRELSRTIEFASLRCLSPTEIMNELADLDETDDHSDYIARLLDLKLNQAELGLLEMTMQTLVQRAGKVPPRLKKRSTVRCYALCERCPLTPRAALPSPLSITG